MALDAPVRRSNNSDGAITLKRISAELVNYETICDEARLINSRPQHAVVLVAQAAPSPNTPLLWATRALIS
jgi:hypothetical protein